MVTFLAKFAGRCVACDERIYVGDHIRMTNEGAVHVDCDAAAEAAPAPRPEPEPCTTCWLVHPEGACDR
jgi:hypothetical protein